MISIVLLISNSPSLMFKTLGTIPSAPITIGITVSFIFHIFVRSLARSKYLSISSLLFIFTVSLEGKNPLDDNFVFFFLTKTLVFWLGYSFVYQGSREFYASHFLGQILGFAFTICLYSQNLIFCTIPSGSSFLSSRDSLLHLLIICLIVTSLSPQNLLSLFCYVLSILMALQYFCSGFLFLTITTIFTPWEFFTLAFADGLSRESEWQQVSSSLQESSR